MARRQCYTVEYKMHQCAEVERCYVVASSKEEAWETATFDQIPWFCGDRDGRLPYSAWVSGVTYQNGNYKRFNTFEGKPY